MLEIFEIWICHIFAFFWLPKATSTLSKGPMDRDGDDDNNKVYLNTTDSFYHLVHEAFQLQMGFSFPFLRANDLCSSLLNIKAHTFFTLFYVEGTYARLVYNWYRFLFHAFAVLIVFHAANEKTGRKED